MKRVGTFITGLLVGATLFGGTAAYAAGIMAEQSTNRFLVDGREVQLNAYAINGSNYLKLRDIGEAVGFNVYWDSEKHCVQIESDAPYTGVAPADNNAEITPLASYEQSKKKPTPQAGDVILRSDGYAYEINAPSFWPRRSEQITESSSSCSPGEYSMEAWDVYCDGAFRCTEYYRSQRKCSSPAFARFTGWTGHSFLPVDIPSSKQRTEGLFGAASPSKAVDSI